ncbi:hypothetical protein [Clostridium paraputrificum]|uniref:Uncharacterized protein n=1 Tax=Clostridium paraputrificum TaxID=29363 RepID=A0A1B8RSW1_9CLOT|nr:hypothetical protein [Clostridium paraputrificum]OBY11882.1 hypothetical protein CP373A1_02865 [Clostridium paraputrificum]
MKKIGNKKEIILIILALIILWDFFFNNRMLLTSFAEWFTNITTKIGRRIGEEFSKIIMDSINQ